MRSVLFSTFFVLALSVIADPAYADYRRDYAAYGQALAEGDYAGAALKRRLATPRRRRFSPSITRSSL